MLITVADVLTGGAFIIWFLIIIINICWLCDLFKK